MSASDSTILVFGGGGWSGRRLTIATSSPAFRAPTPSHGAPATNSVRPGGSQLGYHRERFFTEANLTAQRELALRLVAQRVEGQLEDTTAGQQLPLVTDRVLVLVDGSPASVRAIRRAAKLACALHTVFVAVFVDTPASDSQPFDRNRDLQEAIDDAVDLGADCVRVEAPDVATGLEQIARSRRATHLVVQHHEVKGLRRLTERSLLGQMPTSRSTP